MSAAAPSFGLYVHWPFCLSKCPYCDFNSHVAADIDEPAWARAYLAEMETLAAPFAGRRLESIFFGGGTPSLMRPETVAAVIARARELWPAGWDAAAPEITLEANPGSVEAARFGAFAGAGVNRVSVGVQALDDDALGFLGRGHSAAEALAALATARRHFARVNADMIYARPGQTAASWAAELGRLLAEGLGHLSLYQLTIERGTPFFGLHRKGAFALPGEDEAAALYEVSGHMLDGSGLRAYEVSNYARPGEECRHNLLYWRAGAYGGIGPGAHGRVPEGETMMATANLRRPADWLAAVEAGGSGRAEAVALGPRERLAELAMMGLRLADGIAEDDVRRVSGAGLAGAFDGRRLARLAEGGFVELAGGRLRATPAGRLRLDAVVAELLV